MNVQNEQINRPMVTRDFLLLLVAAFLCFTTFGVFYLFPLFVMELGGNKSDIGVLMGVTALSAVGVRPWVSSLVDRFGRKASFGLGCLLVIIVGIVHIYVVAPIDSIFILLLLLA